MHISRIILYDEPSVPEIKINDLADFLYGKIGIPVEVRKNFFSFHNSDRDIAKQIAVCKILNTLTEFENHKPSIEEIILEEETLSDSYKCNKTILYDGFEFQKILYHILKKSKHEEGEFHIVFTTRLTCTYDYGDYRYHARAVICSNPAIISTTGIIEAPAKPREFYLNIYEKMAQGLDIDSVKEQFRGKFLEYSDHRLSQVVRGYALQAIFYHMTGEAFCDSKDCMLYNSHWQEELLHSQVKLGVLCDKHQKILQSKRFK